MNLEQTELFLSTQTLRHQRSVKQKECILNTASALLQHRFRVVFLQLFGTFGEQEAKTSSKA